MPKCEKCGKESKNLRVCPFCFTPYSTPGTATAESRVPAATGAAGAGFSLATLSPVVKFGLPALVVAVTIWLTFAGREPDVPVGVVAKDVITTPMSKGIAEAYVRQANARATVRRSGNETTVTFAAANWPQRRVGQLALAQQYARALAVIEGSRRTISFRDPTGAPYAKADAAGVTMLK